MRVMTKRKIKSSMPRKFQLRQDKKQETLKILKISKRERDQREELIKTLRMFLIEQYEKRNDIRSKKTYWYELMHIYYIGE